MPINPSSVPYGTRCDLNAILRLPSKWLARLRQRVTNRSLCARCRKMLRQYDSIILEDPNPNMTTQHLMFTASDLLEDKAERCALCMLFLSPFSQEMKDLMRKHANGGCTSEEYSASTLDRFSTYVDLHREIKQEGGTHSLPNLGNLTFNYFPPLESIFPEDAHSELKCVSNSFVLQDPTAPCFQNLSAKVAALGSTTMSTETMSLAKSWLYTCNTTHDCYMNKSHLMESSMGWILPTRLVDIGDVGSPIQPRLRLSADLGGNVKYLTLSHCWGDFMPIRLLRQNLATMMQSIDPKELSQTFQDALAVTKALGMQYIWIDSLCIIQDSEADWQQEAGQMYDVYSNSFCNLSAAASKNGSEGLLRQRDNRPFRPLYVRAINSKRIIVDEKLFWREIEDGPLARRAWVCQERFLSPRNLHFGATQVFWECNKMTACESYPQGLPPDIFNSYKPTITALNSSMSTGRLGTQWNSSLTENTWLDYQRPPNIKAYRVWDELIVAYTKKSLTQETDKLIAIVGIAAQMQIILKNDLYFAGLWRRHFPQHLMWHCGDPQSSRPARYIAPSWSWASVNGSISNTFSYSSCFLNKKNELIKIKSVNVEPEGPKTFGQLKGGEVSLEGKLFRMTLNGTKCGIWAGCLIDANTTVKPDIHIVKGEKVLQKHDHLYCLPVLDVSEMYKELLAPVIGGLCLEATEKVGTFRRFGVFESIHERELMKAALQSFDEKAAESGLEYYDDGKGGYTYTISII